MSNKERQFENLVRSYYRPLFQYAFWMSKSNSVAEDIVQETFARAWKSIDQLKDIKAVKSWLYTILTRENARRFERKQLPVINLSESWQLEQVASPNDDYEVLDIRRAIMALPETYREPLALQVIGGLSTEEIANVLSIKSNTVSTRLFRARSVLKSQLSGNFGSTIAKGGRKDG
ncbi:sigma-70 family RNA polymerase sigma factor [Aliikangiella sp. G2MR2-5]|uniref:sigma-70 family RNA polymerase sigma factor n=1 Tax=Aliikangiella sp. G2MR2-5 TaxID=2788943 RepID=UPI0018AC4EA8|nr:sigma-70 family RNA polymerase sigma factor [Aliikangiella sp. G2MR2-5]